MRGGPRVSRYQIRAALIFISQPKMRLLTPCCHSDQVREPIYVAVSNTDVTNGATTWHASGGTGITWTELSSAIADNSYARPNGGWELIVFKDRTDSKRRGLYLPVDGRSVSVTFNGWDDYGVMVDSVQK